MILDDRLEFADATALNTGAAGTYNIGDVIDTHGPTIGHGSGMNITRDLGADGELYLVIRVATAATSGGSATGQFRLVSDDTATPSTTTATVHATSAAIAVASMTAGSTVLVARLPSGSYERYVGIQQITAVAAFTAGAVDAFLVNDPAIWRAYADNVA
jgi:hypothetical protein